LCNCSLLNTFQEEGNNENENNQSKIKALASELAKGLKAPADLSALSAQLTKITVEAALNRDGIPYWLWSS